MKQKEYSWKDVALTAYDSLAKSIIIDGAASLIISKIFTKPYDPINDIFSSLPAYFVRGMARDFVDHPIVKENLGEYNYMLPYFAGAIVGGVKSNIKGKEKSIKGAIRTLSYELANDYSNDTTIISSLKTSLFVEESLELFSEKFLNEPSDCKNAAIISGVYSLVINVLYVPISSYFRGHVQEYLTTMGSTNDEVISDI